MSLHTKFQLQMMFYILDIDPTTPNIKNCTTHHKIAKLYLPCTFQTSDIELLSPKIET